LKQQQRATKPSTTIAKTAETPPAPEQVPLATRLQDIRSEALRDRSHTSKLIAQLQAQREQLEEMRNEIDATVAFLRAQRTK
jgi:hypothetical protein